MPRHSDRLPHRIAGRAEFIMRVGEDMARHAGSTNAKAERREVVFLARQCAINLLVTIVMTMLMMLLVFRRGAAVPLWGNGVLVLDLIPSILMPCIGASFVMTRAIDAAAKRGLIRPATRNFATILPKNDLLAGLMLGLGLVAVLGPAFIFAATWLYGTRPLQFSDIVAYKLVFAVILACASTPVIIARAMAAATRISPPQCV